MSVWDATERNPDHVKVNKYLDKKIKREESKKTSEKQQNAE